MLAIGIMAGLATYGQAGLPPETFLQRVIEKSGGADFVFGDERPFPECHASTVVEAGDGALLCAWFGGTKEKNPDVGIWMSRFADGKWAPVKLAAKTGQTAHWNPVLFRDPRRGTYLFFKVGPDVPPWQTYWMRSADNGATWSTPVELVPGDVGGRGPVKNKPIILSDGAWLAPASTEAHGWKAFVDRSEDGGATWQRSADFVFDRRKTHCMGAIQPTLWASAPGCVHALMRTAAGKIARVDSGDGG
ncbi:MAG: exo-alpha-sialidase, partial [Candidatus Hydrogenedentes bacterium]|nr:exo-alpha-sialidase [Candidatus Hydrogenedentota bacterium]